ncbi:EPIDERMAL PATTERNING FACTOR-like protein 6 isoform X1 [Primulina tabacum]|uniref:EPIDERMAL PATTERNING FACTOR-like protein 6 isoform X1 n=1 Tax=Primulina tabacum TaxID=48773 RepID=UPI003F59BA4F
MAHLLMCINTNRSNGFKKWKTQTPLVVVYAVGIFCFFGFCIYGRTNIISSYSSSEYKRMVLSLKANEDYLQQSYDRNKIWKFVNTTRIDIIGARRLLSGPGSSPPRCTSKCSRCVPCKPVRVTVPPETTEYYPEAWRCKCRNKLYMP